MFGIETMSEIVAQLMNKLSNSLIARILPLTYLFVSMKYDCISKRVSWQNKHFMMDISKCVFFCYSSVYNIKIGSQLNFLVTRHWLKEYHVAIKKICYVFLCLWHKNVFVIVERNLKSQK